MTSQTKRVVSFVSSQGGLGRSMALANVGWALASSGARVLAVDFNLASPSLHRYFGPFLDDAKLLSTAGLIDAALEFSTRALESPASRKERFFDGNTGYGIPLDWDFPGGGCLDLLPAGRQSTSYAESVLGFAWRPFLRGAGGDFIAQLLAWMRSEYDYTLIDAPAGFSETSQLCIEQLPDTLALCFGLSPGSLESAARLAERAKRAKPSTPPAIFPVPLRVDAAETELYYERIGKAKHTLPPIAFAWETYWGEVAVPYTPFYAYHELLAAFSDLPGEHSVLASAGRLASYLAEEPGLAARLLTESRYPNASQRAEIVRKYDLLSTNPPTHNL